MACVYQYKNKLFKTKESLMNYIKDEKSIKDIPTEIKPESPIFQLSSAMPEITKQALYNIVNNLKSRFKIDISIVESDEEYAGKYNKDGSITLNMTYLKSDTPWHEIAHPFIDMIEKKDPLLFENLKTEILKEKTTLDMIKSESYYKDLDETEQIKETMARIIGIRSSKMIDRETGNALDTVIARILRAISQYIKDLITITNVYIFDRPNYPYSKKEIIERRKNKDILFIKPNTTLSQLSAFITLGKAELDLRDNSRKLLYDSAKYQNKHSQLIDSFLKKIEKLSEEEIDEISTDVILEEIVSEFPSTFYTEEDELDEIEEIKEIIEATDIEMDEYKKALKQKYKKEKEKYIKDKDNIMQIIKDDDIIGLYSILTDYFPNFRIQHKNKEYIVRFLDPLNPEIEDIFNKYIPDSLFHIKELNKYVAILDETEEYLTHSNDNTYEILGKITNFNNEYYKEEIISLVSSQLIPTISNKILEMPSYNNYIISLMSDKENELSNRNEELINEILTRYNKEIFFNILFANDIITDAFLFNNYNILKSLNPNNEKIQELYIKTKQLFNKNYLKQLKSKKNKLKSIKNIYKLLDELDIDTQDSEIIDSVRFIKNVDSADILENDDDGYPIGQPIPMWFLDSVSIEKTNKYYSDIKSKKIRKFLFIYAQDEWEKKIFISNYKTDFEKLLKSRNLDTYKIDYFYPDYIGNTFKFLNEELKVLYSLSNIRNNKNIVFTNENLIKQLKSIINIKQIKENNYIILSSDIEIQFSAVSRYFKDKSILQNKNTFYIIGKIDNNNIEIGNINNYTVISYNNIFMPIDIILKEEEQNYKNAINNNTLYIPIVLKNIYRSKEKHSINTNLPYISNYILSEVNKINNVNYDNISDIEINSENNNVILNIINKYINYINGLTDSKIKEELFDLLSKDNVSLLTEEQAKELALYYVYNISNQDNEYVINKDFLLDKNFNYLLSLIKINSFDKTNNLSLEVVTYKYSIEDIDKMILEGDIIENCEI